MCSGEGVVWDIWRRKTSHCTLLMCIAGSPHRRLLMKGWLFLRFGESRWAHVGLVYLSPQRFTYLQVHHLEEQADGRHVLRARLDAKGWPETMHEVTLAQSLPLERDMRLRVYKLIAWEAPMCPFRVGAHLTVEPLDSYLPMVCNDIQYWKGRETELREEQERRQRKADGARERRKRAEAKAKTSPASKAAPAP